MSKDKWNETGRVWEEDHTWLDEAQQAKCDRANESNMFQSPIPTQMISRQYEVRLDTAELVGYGPRP